MPQIRTRRATRRRHHRLAAAAATLAAAGCGADARPPTTPPPDPAAVCRGYAAALYTADTVHDPSRAAAAQRARTFLTGPSASTAAGSRPTADAQWTLWTRHQARTAVQVTDASREHPPDTAARAYRAAQVTVTAAGRDGWRGGTEEHTVFCQLARLPDRWAVDGYSLT